MEKTDRRVEIYITRNPAWREELLALRAIMLESPLTEAFKWRSPVYTFAGGNVASIARYKQRAVLSFFKGVLLEDPAGILAKPGDNSRSARTVSFTSVAGIEALRPVLLDYLGRAARIEQEGLKVDFPEDDLAIPDELTEALARDPDLAAAFEALTPGRRRGWILHIGQAKQSKTRVSRIAKAAPSILQGKGMHDD